MASFTVKEEAYVKYSMTTWQGEVEMDDEIINYRYSEDDNGAELYILGESGWESADLDEETGNEKHKLLWGAIMMWGTPEDFGSVGEVCDIDEDELEDYI